MSKAKMGQSAKADATANAVEESIRAVISKPLDEGKKYRIVKTSEEGVNLMITAKSVSVQLVPKGKFKGITISSLEELEDLANLMNNEKVKTLIQVIQNMKQKSSISSDSEDVFVI